MGGELRSIRGVHDGMPAEVMRWRTIEQAATDVLKRYHFSEVRLPVLEQTNLFVRSIGSDTDIVDKEMYTFEDRGGDFLSLRPEGTAGAVRAYLQAGLTRSGQQRWYYFGPMFRRERPQKGRLRQFQQIGVEVLGAKGPLEDVEVIALANDLLDALSIRDIRLEINSLGCPVCRPGYRQALVEFLQTRKSILCSTCQTRLLKNPMRVLDCKVEGCQPVLAEAPEMLAHACADCVAHFTGLKQGLGALKASYVVNPRIVRGLDYYTRTAFEYVTDRLGAQGAVIAGGRYDGLVKELGGPETPAIGFALWLERLAMLMPQVQTSGPDVAVVALGEAVWRHSLQLSQQLREANLAVVHCGTGAAKAQFKRADREGARFVLIIGEAEMQKDVVSLKCMRDGSQQEMTVAQAIRTCQEKDTA